MIRQIRLFEDSDVGALNTEANKWLRDNADVIQVLGYQHASAANNYGTYPTILVDYQIAEDVSLVTE